MIKIKEGNFFEAQKGIICFQANCLGTLGQGMMQFFKEKYPLSFKKFLEKCYGTIAEDLLGSILIRSESPNIYSCCMFIQKTWHGKKVCNTDYQAFRQCCQEIKKMIYNIGIADIPINMPYGIGAGVGGGQWNTLYSILEEELSDYNVTLWQPNS